MSNIATFTPVEDSNSARLFTINDVPFLLVPTNVTIFLSDDSK